MLLSKPFSGMMLQTDLAEIDLLCKEDRAQNTPDSELDGFHLGERADLELKVCAPIMSEQNYDILELFL